MDLSSLRGLRLGMFGMFWKKWVDKNMWSVIGSSWNSLWSCAFGDVPGGSRDGAEELILNYLEFCGIRLGCADPY